MQERHIDRKRYFEEQAQTSRNYYIPWIKNSIGHLPAKVLEVGCGEAGNLLPFAESGCEVVGVDIATSRIQQARTFFADKNQKAVFIASDIFQLKDLEKTFPLILIHDVIEHIGHKVRFLSGLKEYLSPGGALFVAFPAWQMPFGGHQQIARGRIISHLPFIHLLPRFLYRWLLKACGEKEDTIKELLSIKQTGCTIEMFRNIARQAGYEIINEQLYFINPHYEVKFGISPRKLNKVVSSIPYLKNFFSTSCFYVLRRTE
ncbi:class I SAM-dependent methyltransferase [Bacteroides sp. UBA939]|uniref:class I SAM-dependent methyltransferase n=1 Tax=Bacteroides sp. UBA939 TaxID=1946092 RepID=UPI0025C154B6|nr:class I SAM-dependent methyltransferase [Bacteroides sp. UBA939]